MQAERAKVVWSPQAQDDLGEVWRWGVAQFSFAAADNHARSIHAAADRLRFAPLVGRSRDDLRPGVREIVIYPTVLLYRVSAEVVEVLRVVDGRRNLAALFPSS
jgi:toxin ParE1/3/4